MPACAPKKKEGKNGEGGDGGQEAVRIAARSPVPPFVVISAGSLFFVLVLCFALFSFLAPKAAFLRPVLFFFRGCLVLRGGPLRRERPFPFFFPQSKDGTRQRQGEMPGCLVRAVCTRPSQVVPRHSPCGRAKARPTRRSAFLSANTNKAHRFFFAQTSCCCPFFSAHWALRRRPTANLSARPFCWASPVRCSFVRHSRLSLFFFTRRTRRGRQSCRPLFGQGCCLAVGKNDNKTRRARVAWALWRDQTKKEQKGTRDAL